MDQIKEADFDDFNWVDPLYSKKDEGRKKALELLRGISFG